MSQLTTVTIFAFTILTAFLFSISPFTHFLPQTIALFTIILIIFSLYKKQYFIFFISLIINLIVFSTNSLNSPVFFLVYFLIFTISFQNPPSISLSYSLILILFLSQSLNSPTSLLPLLSLLLITPLAWFISKQYINNIKINSHLTNDETNLFLWSTLKFKTGITSIIDSASQLLSQPQLNHSQKQLVHHIKDSAKNLLNSSQKLTHEIEKTDEN